MIRRIQLSIFASIVIGLVLTSCSAAEEDDFTSVYEDAVLTLNDGDKWEVPEVMKVYMDSSMTIIASLSNESTLSTSQQEALLRQKEGFVSNCSMEGKGHDVLHAWLLPYIDLLKDFPEVNTKDLLKAKELYHSYFK